MDTLALLNAAFDLVVVVLLPVVALGAVVSADLFKAIILFITLGLLLALTWVRLAAPDVALAEAAIGSGLTGALLLSARERLTRTRYGQDRRTPRPGKALANRHSGSRRALSRSVAVALVMVAVAGLAVAVLALPHDTAGLAALVQSQMPLRDLANRVTFVLLDLRGYDTLLELSVLLLAAAAVWSLSEAPQIPIYAVGPMLKGFAGGVGPIMVLVAGYLLWAGADAPGGAFQAGVVLGALSVLLSLADRHPLARLPGWALRLAVGAGVMVFLAVGTTTMVFGKHFLEYPQAHAKALILVIEAAAMVSIGLILVSLYAGGRLLSDEPGTRRDLL